MAYKKIHQISDQEDTLLDYKHETSTYFRFNTDGLNIGKQEDGDESPYSINIDNEKMGFLQNGVEIAYRRLYFMLQYAGKGFCESGFLTRILSETRLTGCDRELKL